MNLKFSLDTETSAQATPAPAATVILLRDCPDGPFEVFLMRRHRRQSFMGGAFVFPGGRLDSTDGAADLVPFVMGWTWDQARRALQAPELQWELALGFYMAVIREAFEEAGVLLAVARDRFDQPLDMTGITPYRTKLHDGQTDLKQMAVEAGLVYRLDWLQPYSHWITPEVEKKRFDTRFFLARLPLGQKPSHDAVELTESLWLKPQEALDGHGSGRITLMPPTLITLGELARLDSIEQAFALAAKRRFYPIMPQAYMDGQTIGLKLPHDPEYSIQDFQQPVRPEEISRLLLVDGKWRTVEPHGLGA